MTFAAKLPSGPNKPVRIHCASVREPLQSLCYEYGAKGSEFRQGGSEDPDTVNCPHCLRIMRRHSLYNYLKARLRK